MFFLDEQDRQNVGKTVVEIKFFAEKKATFEKYDKKTVKYGKKWQKLTDFL